MASWWSITVPSGFQDVSQEANANPAFKASLDKMTADGGTVSAHFWTNENSVILAIEASFGDMPNSTATLDGFEDGARKTSYGTGKEHAYTLDKDAHFYVAHQHATASAGQETWSTRITGRGTDGALKSIGVTCSGPEATCKPALATLTVDAKDFVALSSIPKDGKSSAYAIGYAVGTGLAGLVLLYILMKARQRARAA